MHLPPFCRPSSGPVDAAAREAWAEASENYLKHCAREANWNKLIEIPAMREMLGDPTDLRTLEVGCGPAHYSIWLAENGAEAHGLDPSARLLEAAEANAARAGAALHLRNGGVECLAEYPDGRFDIVLFPMMLEYVDDLEAVFGQARRLLSPGGFVAISVVHPMRNFSRPHVVDGTELRIVSHYLDAGVIEWSEWIMKRDDGTQILCKSNRRTIEQIITPLAAAGFLVESIVEPDAVEGAEAAKAGVAESNRHCPQFMLIKAVPDPRRVPIP